MSSADEIAKAARDVVRNLVSIGVITPAVSNVILAAIRKEKPVKLTRESKRAAFIRMVESGPVSVDTVRETLGWGKGPAYSAAWYYSRLKSEEDRLYIKLANGVWSIVGRGPTPPPGWETKQRKVTAPAQPSEV